MIFTKIYIDNLYSFHDCEIDLSLKGNVGRSTIPHEHLKGYEKFRFRRVCIISGANASGKTALGKVLFYVQNLCCGERRIATNELVKCINNKEKDGVIKIEFVTKMLGENKYCFNYMEIYIKNDKSLPNVKNYSIKLSKKDTVSDARKKIQKSNELCGLNCLQPFATSWGYIFSENMEDPNIPTMNYIDNNVLKEILMNMDSSIKSVDNIENDEFRIIFSNGDKLLIDSNGITNKERLSSGTFDSIKIALLLSKIISDKKDCITSDKCITHTYFLDERMSKVHSELEVSIVNLMIDKLPHNAQLFYTTHNYDVLEMNLPLHSFLFMGKKQGKTIIVQPEKNEIIRKNKKNLLYFLKNDFFSILPETDRIDELLFNDD